MWVAGKLCDFLLALANLSTSEMSIAHIIKCYTSVLITLVSASVHKNSFQQMCAYVHSLKGHHY